jgi:hypothetical protein
MISSPKLVDFLLSIQLTHDKQRTQLISLAQATEVQYFPSDEKALTTIKIQLFLLPKSGRNRRAVWS